MYKSIVQMEALLKREEYKKGIGSLDTSTAPNQDLDSVISRSHFVGSGAPISRIVRRRTQTIT